ncbi:hypothetical protein ACJJTC_013985 [Scirpophaga incertulas]
MPRKVDKSETDIRSTNRYVLCNFCNRKFILKGFLLKHLFVCDPNFSTGNQKKVYGKKRQEPHTNKNYVKVRKNCQTDYFNVQRCNSNNFEKCGTGPPKNSTETFHFSTEIVNSSEESKSPSEEIQNTAVPKDDITERTNITRGFKQSDGTLQRSSENSPKGASGSQSPTEVCDIYNTEPRDIRRGYINIEKSEDFFNDSSVSLVQSEDTESEKVGIASEDNPKIVIKKRKGRKSLKCKVCNVICENKSALYFHKSQKHPENFVKLEDFSSETKCVCQKAYSTHAKLRFHIRKDHFNLQATLPYCEQKKVNQVWFEKVRNCNNIMEIKKTAPNTLVMRKMNEKTAIKVVESNRQTIDLTEMYPTSIRRNNKDN